jgi:hypothetical protein
MLEMQWETREIQNDFSTYLQLSSRWSISQRDITSPFISLRETDYLLLKIFFSISGSRTPGQMHLSREMPHLPKTYFISKHLSSGDGPSLGSASPYENFSFNFSVQDP